MTVTTTSTGATVCKVQDVTTCAGCRRPYGRDRLASLAATSSFALLPQAQLVVCDQCLSLAGGRRAVISRLVGVAITHAAAARARAVDDDDMRVDDVAVEQALVFAPAVAAVFAAVDDFDALHPIDRVLVNSGVRWTTLRHIVVPARMQLAGDILRRVPPCGTGSAASAQMWLDEVQSRMDAQTGPGGTFRYRTKRRRWARIAALYAEMADRDRRPLTWITQEEVAGAVSCSTRTVRRAVAWLIVEGLLWEVVPGCRLPQQAVPDEETPAEAAERASRMLAEATARAARRKEARAEVDALHAGHRGDAAATAAQIALGLDLETGPLPDVSPVRRADDVVLVHLSPVYELRTPLDPVHGMAQNASTASTDPEVTARGSGFVHPPQVLKKDLFSSSAQTVEEQRRAPRGPQNEGLRQLPVDDSSVSMSPCQTAGSALVSTSEPIRTPQSEAVNAAEWLIHTRLDKRLRAAVSPRWLAARIRETHLLSRHGWSWDDVADLIHGAPDYPHLPREIRNPRGWIRARMRTAIPALPPRQLLEGTWERFLRDRHLAAAPPNPDRSDGVSAAAEDLDAARRAWALARAAAIAACSLCDEYGWRSFGLHVPDVKCSHTDDW